MRYVPWTSTSQGAIPLMLKARESRQGHSQVMAEYLEWRPTIEPAGVCKLFCSRHWTEDYIPIAITASHQLHVIRKKTCERCASSAPGSSCWIQLQDKQSIPRQYGTPQNCPHLTSQHLALLFPRRTAAYLLSSLIIAGTCSLLTTVFCRNLLSLLEDFLVFR